METRSENQELSSGKRNSVPLIKVIKNEETPVLRLIALDLSLLQLIALDLSLLQILLRPIAQQTHLVFFTQQKNLLYARLIL